MKLLNGFYNDKAITRNLNNNLLIMCLYKSTTNNLESGTQQLNLKYLKCHSVPKMIKKNFVNKLTMN